MMGIDYDGVHGDGTGFAAYYNLTSAILAFKEITTMGIKFGRPKVEYVTSTENVRFKKFQKKKVFFFSLVNIVIYIR